MLMLLKVNDNSMGKYYTILFILRMFEIFYNKKKKKLPEMIAKFSVFVRRTKIQMSGWLV